jgi:alpha-tubulin suppressor-like RCC1 family protein
VGAGAGLDTDWVDIQPGEYVTCGIRPDDDLWCWGDTSYGDIGIDAPLLTWYTQPTATQIEGPVAWSTAELAANVACGILSADDSLWCWGQNWSFQLGSGERGYQMRPLQIDAGSWIDLSVGGNTNCGIDGSHALWCWGDNGTGQLGINANDGPERWGWVDNQVGSTVPLQESTGATDWQQVSTTGAVVCGIREDAGGARTAWCWGEGRFGQLGHNLLGEAKADKWMPTEVGVGDVAPPADAGVDAGVIWEDTWAQIETGGDHTCGIRDDGMGERTLWCWGYNYNGQLGNGTSGSGTEVTLPTQEATYSTNWESLSMKYAWGCAIKTDGTLWCWGSNYSGRLGTGGGDKNVPTQVGSDTDWASVATSTFWHACGVKDDGSLWCWGDNQKGAFGDGTTSGSSSPRRVGTANDWAQTSGGNYSSCHRKTNGTVWCSGWNIAGQMATGEPWFEYPQLLP